MPLLDHFVPPIDERISWPAFHSSWATRLADAITDVLPAGFTAEVSHPSGGQEIDVATYEDSGWGDDPLRADWQPPAPDHATVLAFPERHEVKVYRTTGGRTLVAAIELVNPSNKDRPAERLAFATKCAANLFNGVSPIVVDVVTERGWNLHNDIVRAVNAPAAVMLPNAALYRAVCRRVPAGDPRRGGRTRRVVAPARGRRPAAHAPATARRRLLPAHRVGRDVPGSVPPAAVGVRVVQYPRAGPRMAGAFLTLLSECLSCACCP